jgi:omega-amidase
MKKKISLIQMDVTFGKPAENYRRVVELMAKAMKEKPDILVLPETLNVGFFPTEGLSDLADVNGQKTKEVFGSFAKDNNVNIVAGSVANKKGEHIYNTLYVFNRDGHIVCEYDKVHGFTPLNEHHHFKGGDKVVNFELDGIKCSGVICYDVRFPELIRTATLRGVDLMFVPAQWPLARKFHWVTLVTARAIENQMFVCAVNACGYAGEIKFGGNSLLIDPWGETICHLGTEEEIQTAEIDMDVIQGIRESINIFRDRKPECYNLTNH